LTTFTDHRQRKMTNNRIPNDEPNPPEPLPVPPCLTNHPLFFVLHSPLDRACHDGLPEIQLRLTGH